MNNPPWVNLMEEQVAERVGIDQGRISNIERSNIASSGMGTQSLHAR